MENKRPFLSICIPTYNRSEVLKKTVDSILSSSAFRIGDVEIVVSDNCSTDNTENILTNLCKRYDHIIYNRNERNIGGELNFIKVLSIATGKFIKLHNDYCPFSHGGLEYMLSTLRKYEASKPFVVFSIRSLEFRIQEYYDFNSFVFNECMSLHWISSIGFWFDDFKDLKNKDQLIKTLFLQTDWSLRIAKNKNTFIACIGDLYSRVELSQQGGYHFISVFSKYPSMYDVYYNSGYISKKTRIHIDRTIFKNLVYWYYVLNVKKDSHYSYNSENSFNILKNTFGKYMFFYPIFINRCCILLWWDTLSKIGIKRESLAVIAKKILRFNISHS